jgi:CheY-like chemotaxis protein
MKKILIIDDSGFSRMKLKKMLRVTGAEISEAKNGLEALKVVDDMTFDLIISDLLMPEMDGNTFVTEFRKKDADTPVYVLTADIQETTKQILLDSGANGFINKPMTEDKISEIIKTLD